MRIYISSTSEDLADHRLAVISALQRSGHTPVYMEHHAAGDRAPKEECLKEVASCDAYVGMFAWRYGFIPPKSEISITELEYRGAVKRRIPTLVFLLDDKVEWPTKFKEKGAKGKRIRDLRKELQQTKWIGYFSSQDNLVIKVLEALGPVATEKMRVEFLEAQKFTPKKELQKVKLQKLRTEKSEGGRGKKLKVPTLVPIPVPEKLIRHFTDRDDELSKLRQCFSDKNLRMVLICGRAGMGKTTLVTKLIHGLMEDLRNKFSPMVDCFEGIVYVSLGEAGYRTPDRIVELLSRTMDQEGAAELKGIWNQEGTSLRDRLAELFRGPLTQHRCLIVLDNLESVMDDENRILQGYAALRQFIDAFLEYDHASLLIATSRRVLSLSSDVEIASIGRWIQISLDTGLPENFAVSLLRKLDTDGRLGIRDATDEILGIIVRRFLCIPRTLETLVATLLHRPTWTLDTLLANVSLLSRLIEYPARELFASLPSDQERLVMQALAVYGKPVPSAALRSILPALSVDQILDDLFRNFVVNHDRGQFWLHPLDRQYAYNQIPDQGSDYSKPVLHNLAAKYYRSVPCPPKGKRSSLEDVAPMLDALDQLLAAGQVEDAAKLFIENGLHEDLYWWGYYFLLADLCRRFLNLDVSPDGKIILHIQMGKVHRNLGNLEEAKKTYEYALPYIDNSNDVRSEIGLYIALGDVYYYLNDINRSLIYHRQAERLLATNPNPILQSENTGDMANVMWAKGEYKEAQEMYERAIAFSRDATNKIHEGIWNGGLGNVHSSLFINSGDIPNREKAISHYLKAIEIAKETNDRRHESHWNGVLGNFYRQLGEYKLADRHLRKALSISYKINYGRMLSTQVQWLSSIYDERIRRCFQNQDFDNALKIVSDFQRVADEIGTAALGIEANRQFDEV